MKQKHSIAIIGSGITGSVAALSLADEGHRVCLFDKASTPMSGASLVNEGKIHAGFVYVNDPSSRTLDVMVQTSMKFRSILERWITPADFDALVTEPFEYIIPKDTQLPPESIDRQFKLLEDKIREAEELNRARYLGMSRQAIWSRSKTIPETFNPREIIAHYRTCERSVDTRAVASHITNCLEGHDRIDLHLGTTVEKVERADRFWKLYAGGTGKAEPYGPFNFVINSSWEGRLKLDEPVFGPDNGNWFHRYKTAVNLFPEKIDGIPNFTAIIGAYGDLIKYQSGRVYLSWYPSGMLSSSSEISSLKTRFNETIKSRTAKESISGLSQFVPSIDAVFSSCNPNANHVAGGVIMARGKSDIDDSQSELHQRYRIGLIQKDSYISIDTGKYTCGPSFADEAVHRILNKTST